MNANIQLKTAIGLIRSGDKVAACNILKDLLKQDRNNAQAWLWLSACVETDEDRSYCLEEVLRINPHHQSARNALNKIKVTPIVPVSGSHTALELHAPAARVLVNHRPAAELAESRDFVAEQNFYVALGKMIACTVITVFIIFSAGILVYWLNLIH